MADPATAMLTGQPSGGTPPAAGEGGTPPGNGGTPPAGGGYTLTPFTYDPALGADVMKTLTDRAFDKDPNALAKSYHEINRFVAGATDLVAVPGENAAPDLVKRFNKALGIPDSPAGYGDYTFKEGVTPDPKYVDFSKKLFHALGVPASKAQTGLNMWTEFAATRLAEITAEEGAANAQAVKELEVKMGPEKWKAAVTAGQAAFKALGLPADVIEAIEKKAGGPAVMQLMAALGAKLPGEGVVLNGQSNPSSDPANMTLEQLNSAENSLRADKDWNEAYYSATHPKHTEAVQRMIAIANAKVARNRAARGA